jgi:hypothetical protein
MEFGSLSQGLSVPPTLSVLHDLLHKIGQSVFQPLVITSLCAYDDSVLRGFEGKKMHQFSELADHLILRVGVSNMMLLRPSRITPDSLSTDMQYVSSTCSNSKNEPQ